MHPLLLPPFYIYSIALNALLPPSPSPIALLLCPLPCRRRRKMLLGKRQRPRMRRTTSTSEFSLDSHHLDSPSDPTAATGLAVALPMTAAHRRHSGESIETAHFLRDCGFCNRRLAPGKDIYMYMGDTAFCSLECREQGMIQEEGKDKCSNWASVNKGASTSRGSKASNKGGTGVAAA